MKYLIFFLLFLPATLLAQTQWVDATGDTIRVVSKTASATAAAPGVIGVKDSVVQFTVKVPVMGTVQIPYSYKYDTVVVIKKQTTTQPPVVINPPPATGSGQTYAFAVTQRTDKYARPFAGIEYWHDQNIVSLPYTPQDVYFRLSICEVQTGRNTYNWTKFDNWFTAAVKAGRKLSFGFMTVYPDPPSGRSVSYSGSYSAIPSFWYDDMTNDKLPGWKSSYGWIPNYNAPSYWYNLLSFNKAVYAHLVEKGWKDWVNTVDVRGMGSYGEWHHYPYAQTMSAFPSGARPTEASLKAIIEAHIEAFPDLWLVAMISGFDANRLQNTMNPPGIRDYLLTAANQKGPLGWRRDNWGATDSYITQYLSDTRALNRWKVAPVLGEPCCNSGYAAIGSQLKQYGATSFGNGNYGTVTAKNVQDAAEIAGARVTITGGSFKDGVITVNWSNVGTCQVYEDFDTWFELRQVGVVKWSGKSSSTISMRLPGTWTTTDTFTGLPAGEYELHVVVKNGQRGYPLGITSSKVAAIKI